MKILLFVLFFISTKVNIAFAKINNQKPKIIGVVADYLTNKNNIHQYTTYPIHALREQYINNLSQACNKDNVIFIMIPCDMQQVEKFSKIIDGLILTGGWDVDSKYYNAKKHEKSGEDSIIRTDFEIEILKKIIKQKKPIFTICRGTQLANIALGGDMIQDIPSFLTTNINHSAVQNGVGYLKIAHRVKLSKNSLIAKIINKDEIGVNSNHHQALNKIGKDLIVSGISPDDNIIEAIELSGYSNFFLGVQWHPEFLATEEDKLIIQAFCKSVVQSKKSINL